MIVLDTNVISELMRPEPHQLVMDWVAARPRSSLFTTTVTHAEILYGIALLPEGRRRAGLEAAVAAIFAEDLAGRILPFDDAATSHYAVIAAGRRRAGRPIEGFDTQIAAIAHAAGADLATRDIAGFADCDVALIDPWSGA